MLRTLCLTVGLSAAVLLGGCAGSGDRAELGLNDLQFRDGGVITPYGDAVRAPAPESWMTGLPIPTFDVSLISLPKSAAWMAAYDFDGDVYLSRGEMTQAWLVALARWKLGRDFKADQLTAGGKPLLGVHITVDAERSARAVLDELTNAPKVGPRIAETLAGVIRALSLTVSGGDSGRGLESKGLDGWEADGALFGPGATD